MDQIGKPWVVVGQFLSQAKWVNSLKGKFLGAVACPKTDDVEFNHPFDQSGQARCHLQLPSLLIDKWGGGVQLHVHPLWLDMHINKEPFRLRTLP
jgi:hypothetical protein